MCWPTLLGFSFSAKKWGELNVDNITGIEFDDGAFDRLVLSAEKKELIRALVENQDKTFADIISGKGGTCGNIAQCSKTDTYAIFLRWLHLLVARIAGCWQNFDG
jgi:hypothetical protein